MIDTIAVLLSRLWLHRIWAGQRGSMFDHSATGMFFRAYCWWMKVVRDPHKHAARR